MEEEGGEKIDAWGRKRMQIKILVEKKRFERIFSLSTSIFQWRLSVYVYN